MVPFHPSPGLNDEQMAVCHMQDQVLDVLSGCFGPFVLAGGVALSRFYLFHRYSGDLDFMARRAPDFNGAANTVADLLVTRFGAQRGTMVRYPDFLRIVLPGKPGLKIELINHPADRVGPPVMAGGIPVDAASDLLVDKVNCCLERDVPGDFTDLAAFASAFSFRWPEVIDCARSRLMVSQAWVLGKVMRRTDDLMQMIQDSEPRDVLGLFGAASGVHLDYKVVTVRVERKGGLVEPDATTLAGFRARLDQIARSLARSANRADFNAAKIPEEVSLIWGGARVTVTRIPVPSAARLQQRLEMGSGRGPGGDILHRIARDVGGTGENSFGSGKPSLYGALPKRSVLPAEAIQLQNNA